MKNAARQKFVTYNNCIFNGFLTSLLFINSYKLSYNAMNDNLTFIGSIIPMSSHQCEYKEK
jgi:hypothetical protein